MFRKSVLSRFLSLMIFDKKEKQNIPILEIIFLLEYISLPVNSLHNLGVAVFAQI